MSDFPRKTQDGDRRSDRIKAGNDIVDVAHRFGVRLTHKGERMLGLCPIHNERTPSFNIWPGDQKFHCFGCGAHGDVIKLVMEVQNLDFVEAMDFLDPNGGGEYDPAKAEELRRNREVYRRRQEKVEAAVVQVHATVPQTAQPIQMRGSNRTVDLCNPQGLADPKKKLFSGLPIHALYPYCTPTGELVGYVVRSEWTGLDKDGKPKRQKVTPQIVWANWSDEVRAKAVLRKPAGWTYHAFPEPRPVYRGEKLTEALRALLESDDPTAQLPRIIVVEGEKAADAAARIWAGANIVAVSWSGGTKSLAKTDWVGYFRQCLTAAGLPDAQLADIPFTLIPDADLQGAKAMLELGLLLEEAGVQDVWIVDLPAGLEKGWDVADAEKEGLSRAEIEAMMINVLGPAAFAARVEAVVAQAQVDDIIEAEEQDLLAAAANPEAGESGELERAGVIPEHDDVEAPDMDGGPAGGEVAAEPPRNVYVRPLPNCAVDADFYDFHAMIGRLYRDPKSIGIDDINACATLKIRSGEQFENLLIALRQLEGLDVIELQKRVTILAEGMVNAARAAAGEPLHGAGGNGGPPLDPVEQAMFNHGVVIKARGFQGEIYYYYSGLTKEIVPLKRKEHRVAQDLFSLAPRDFWIEAFPPPNGSRSSFDVEKASAWLMSRAHDQGIFRADFSRGRGAWVDPSTDRTLPAAQRERLVYHFGTHLMVNGQRVELEEMVRSGNTRYLYEQGVSIEMPAIDNPLLPGFPSQEELDAVAVRFDHIQDEKERARQVLRAHIQLCKNYAGSVHWISDQLRWENKLSASLFSGWLVLAFLCGMLNWRPHAWLTGGSGSGKSWVMTRIVHPLLEKVSHFYQSTSTEAGIRQNLGIDALTVLFDEAESEDEKAKARIAQILELMRQASSESGGAIAKGGSDGKGRSFQIRSMFMLASISVGIRQQADQSRVTVLSLANPPSDKEQHERAMESFAVLREMAHGIIDEEFASRLFARVLKNAATIRKNIAVCSEAGATIFRSQRLGDQYGPMFAGCWALSSDAELTIDDAIAWMRGQDWAEHAAENIEKDEDRLLRKILSYEFRADGINGVMPYNVTIDEAISAARGLAEGGDDELPLLPADVMKRHLMRFGIKVEAEGMLISNTHDRLQQILEKTPWSSNWSRLLARLPGAGHHPQTVYFGPAIRTRAVFIPFTALGHREALAA